MTKIEDINGFPAVLVASIPKQSDVLSQSCHGKLLIRLHHVGGSQVEIFYDSLAAVTLLHEKRFRIFSVPGIV